MYCGILVMTKTDCCLQLWAKISDDFLTQDSPRPLYFKKLVFDNNRILILWCYKSFGTKFSFFDDKNPVDWLKTGIILLTSTVDVKSVINKENLLPIQVLVIFQLVPHARQQH